MAGPLSKKNTAAAILHKCCGAKAARDHATEFMLAKLSDTDGDMTFNKADVQAWVHRQEYGF